MNLILRCIPTTVIAASKIQKAGMGTDLWMPVVGHSVSGNVSSTQSRLAFGCAPEDKGASAFAVDRRQPPYTRQEAATVSIRLEEESGGEKDKGDDDGTAEEREIWQVTAVTEEDLETTEGEAVDLYDKLMELAGWKAVDNEKRE